MKKLFGIFAVICVLLEGLVFSPIEASDFQSFYKSAKLGDTKAQFTLWGKLRKRYWRTVRQEESQKNGIGKAYDNGFGISIVLTLVQTKLDTRIG